MLFVNVGVCCVVCGCRCVLCCSWMWVCALFFVDVGWVVLFMDVVLWCVVCGYSFVLCCSWM